MTVIALLVILMSIINPSLGFVPLRVLAASLQAAQLSQDFTTTHQDMSRAAILDVAADLLKDNPNPESQGSSSRIATLPILTEESLVSAYYDGRQRIVENSFKDAIAAINGANADVDLGTENKLDEAHFDSEKFQAGQNRLIEIRQNIVTQILMHNFKIARRETGRLFHTLQDFYSHSNWIENGNRVPYDVLGRLNERPGIIADSDRPTCTDCEEDEIKNINFFDVTSITSQQYICQDNIIHDLKRKEILTSGYANRNMIRPAGKCSHGGFLDPESNKPTGGINKDSPYKIWSPHYYLYEEALNVAQQATTDLLNEIRGDVDNDQLFISYMGLNVQTISIAYVIDTSTSMAEELLEIQATIPTIRTDFQQYVGDKVRVRYILAPFNDPGLCVWDYLSCGCNM